MAKKKKKAKVRRRVKVSTRRKRSRVRSGRTRVLRVKQEVAEAFEEEVQTEEFELTATTKGWTPKRRE